MPGQQELKKYNHSTFFSRKIGGVKERGVKKGRKRNVYCIMSSNLLNIPDPVGDPVVITI